MKNIKILVGEKKTRLFLVPKDRAEGIVRLLQDFEVTKGSPIIPWRDSVKDLIEKYTEAGVALKGSRTKAGLSQNELAEKLGIPQSHISEHKKLACLISQRGQKLFNKEINLVECIFLKPLILAEPHGYKKRHQAHLERWLQVNKIIHCPPDDLI